MSSILRTIDALKEIHIGDYVQFHNGRLGYVEQILPNDLIGITEDDGSLRPRRYHVRSNLVAVIPQSGVTAVENRTLLQPPSPGVNNISTTEDNINDDTKELIDILKKTHQWTANNNTNDHPFFNYLTLNNDKDKGWIRNVLPKHTMNNKSGKDLTSKQRMIYITTYNLFDVSGFHD